MSLRTGTPGNVRYVINERGHRQFDVGNVAHAAFWSQAHYWVVDRVVDGNWRTRRQFPNWTAVENFINTGKPIPETK